MTLSDAMRQEDMWDQEAAQRYDTPGTGMFAPEVLGPTVDRLAELAGEGRALEFAVGTGRVAIPLAQRGVPVTGIELSGPMIELRTKADEAAISMIAGDVSAAPNTLIEVQGRDDRRGAADGRATGFPLMVASFEGNKAETKTMLPVITSFMAAHHLCEVTVVVDAGMILLRGVRQHYRKHAQRGARSPHYQ